MVSHQSNNHPTGPRQVGGPRTTTTKSWPATQHEDLPSNAQRILKNHRIPVVPAKDDPKLLRDAIERRVYQQPEPPILHEGFPLIGSFEAHCKSQIRSARGISPNRRPTLTRASSAPLSTGDKYAELTKLCVGNRVADLKILLDQPAFDVRGRQASSALAEALLSATEFGFYDVVKTLLAAGVNPNVYRRIKEGTSLHIAVAAGNVGMVKLLLAHRADVNVRCGPAETALKLAVLTGTPSTEIITMLLQAGARIQDADKYPSSLQACAYRDQRAILGQFCAFATEDNINFAHPVHGTALETAAAYGKLECARILQDFGAKFNVPCMPYGSPLHAAVYWGQYDMSKLALRDVETNPSDGNLLDLAVSHGHYEIAEMLLDRATKAQTPITNSNHEKLIKAAITSGSTKTLKLLLEAGVRPDGRLQDDSGLSVASAIANGHCAMACTMIDNGFDREGKPSSYYEADCSPIIMAARTGDLEMVRYLVAIDAEVHDAAIKEAATVGNLELLVYFAHKCRKVFEKERNAALLAAIKSRNRLPAAYLASEGAVVEKPAVLLAELFDNDSVKALRLLVDLIGQNNFSVTAQNNILCKALSSKRWDMAETLMDIFDDLRHNRHQLDEDTLDPLNWAVNEKDLVALKMLLKFGFDPNIFQDERGNSPLCRAVRKGDLQLVKALLRYKANPNASVHTRGNSVSLLCFAISLCPLEDLFFGFQKEEGAKTDVRTPQEIVMALLDAGAYVDENRADLESDGEELSDRRRDTRREKSGRPAITPLYVAANRGLYDVVMLLLRRGARFTPSAAKIAGNAMRRALFRDDIKSAELLLRAGADVDDQMMRLLEQAGFKIEGRSGSHSDGLRLVRCRASSDSRGSRSSGATGSNSWQLLLGPVASHIAESMPEYLERRKAAKSTKSGQS